MGLGAEGPEGNQASPLAQSEATDRVALLWQNPGTRPPRGSRGPEAALIHMAKALLLGNGVNRLSGTTAWADLLTTLAESVGARDVLELASLKPFALIYEEIAFRSNATNRAEESA